MVLEEFDEEMHKANIKAEAKEEGRKEAREEVAKKMLSANFSVKDISVITGLSAAEIAELQ